MQKPLIFLGTGDRNLEIPLSICNLRGIPVEGVVDSDYFGNTDHSCGVPIIGSEKDFDFDAVRNTHQFFVGQSAYVKDPRTTAKRLAYIDMIEQLQLTCATLIHPVTEILSDVVIEPGCLIGFCTGIGWSVRIGKHSQLHAFSMLAHHTTIGQNSILSPHTSCMPYTAIGNNVTIGPGAGIIRTGNGTVIGDNAIIHPRVTVARDIEPYEIVSLAGDNTRRIYGEVVRS